MIRCSCHRLRGCIKSLFVKNLQSKAIVALSEKNFVGDSNRILQNFDETIRKSSSSATLKLVSKANCSPQIRNRQTLDLWTVTSHRSTFEVKAVNSHQRQVMRSMFGVTKAISKVFKGNHIEKARVKYFEDPSNEKLLLDYLSLEMKANPLLAMKKIQGGWESNTMPFNEATIKEYINASISANKFQDVKLMGLLRLLETLQNKENGDKSVKNQAKQSTFSTLAHSASISQLSASLPSIPYGSSPDIPLFIKDPQRSNQGLLFGRFVIVVIVSAILFATIFEGNGQSNGNNGSLSSRLGIMQSIVHQAEQSDKSFEDVVGIDEAKAELQEIVFYLKDPKIFTRLGGVLPKGVLLTGAPGTGKTLLARAIAGEAGVPFFYTSGSEFEEMYVGVGAKRVRDLFAAAKAKSPCIVFIDEIDAIGGSRNLKEQSAMKATLNQLLVEMDGFEQNTGIILIAATNFPDSLDSALIRPGRFDKHVDVPLPDIGGRKAILDLYSKKVLLSSDVDLEQIARGTPGFSGAELFNLVNQAAIKASMEGRKAVTMASFEHAKDKIMMGAERKSAIISEDTLKLTAFHEAGHAVVAIMTEGSDPVHKATIMPRGRALGMVMQLPDGDQTSMTYKQMLARLDICMGGRIAEEIVFGGDNVTSGASSDIQQATRLAKAMVTRYGMSAKLGPYFLDTEKEKLSGETMRDVDDEVRLLLKQSYDRTRLLLQDKTKELEIIAKGLLEYESLSGSEIVDLLSGTRPSKGVLRSQQPSRIMKPITPIRNANGSPKTSTVVPKPIPVGSKTHPPLNPPSPPVANPPPAVPSP